MQKNHKGKFAIAKIKHVGKQKRNDYEASLEGSFCAICKWKSEEYEKIYESLKYNSLYLRLLWLMWFCFAISYKGFQV